MYKTAEMSHRFGVEVEVKHVSRSVVAKMIANCFDGSRVRRERDHYDTHMILGRGGRIWKCVSDGSLNDGNKGCEIVSPVLRYVDEDLKDLESILTGLRTLFPIVDEECSVHVHVDATQLSLDAAINLQKMWYAYEDLIYDALKVKPSREERYCKRTDEHFMDTLLRFPPEEWYDFREFWYSSCDDEDEDYKYNSSRYHALNFHSLFRQDTIEFRLFNGTIDFSVINAYIQFCQALVSRAEKLRRPKGKRISADNEKFTMRNWLRNLGLNGDTFKTCRKVFLCNLQGNSSRRMS